MPFKPIMPLKPREWVIEGIHPQSETEALEMLDAGKMLAYQQLRPGETWATVEGKRHIYVAHQNDGDDGAPVYFIDRLNEQGSTSPEGSMMFHCLSWPLNTPKYEFMETLELIAPQEEWMTLIRKESP